MFTFSAKNAKNEENKRVSRIVGGNFSNKILYLDTDLKPQSKKISFQHPEDLLHEDFYKVKNYKLMDPQKRNVLMSSLKKYYEEEDSEESYTGSETEEESEEEIYFKKAKSIIREKTMKNIELNDGGKMNICPDSKPERIYISGANGSGKSFIAGVYMKEYHRLYPKNNIFMFSIHDYDESYKDIKMIRLDLKDPTLTDEPLDHLKFKNCLIVFDDTDSLQDKKLQKWIDTLEKALLTDSRKYGVYMLCLNHMLMNYTKTREKINECSRYVLFPSSGSTYHITRFLKVYCSMSKDQIKKVLTTPSRWVCVSLTYGQYVLYDTGAYLLSTSDI